MAKPKPARHSAAAKKRKSSTPRLSPLLRSAFEMLEHGLWHYLRSETTTDMKFALLHVDQAVELILKERVRQGGQSIYKNPKETISIWGAYSILEGTLKCAIPEKPNLELLHEERNNIQHKYANPTVDDAAFHIDNAMKFIDRFLRDELSLELADHVPTEYISEVL